MSAATAPPLPGAMHQAPNDWEFYIEGRIESKQPARLDPASQQWLREMGLDELAGPGAWASYEDQNYAELARAVEADRRDRARKAGKNKTSQEKPDTSLPWRFPQDKPGI
jgi:hypothetical protein